MSYTINHILTFQVIFNINSVFSSYLDVTNHFHNNRHERNNIVNKGVWIRNANQDSDKLPISYIFRGNSVDVDNVMQGEFAAFSDGNVPNSPFITSYVERNKRSADDILKKLWRSKKSMKTNDISDPSMVKSKFLSKLKPASVFNDYPYEIAILLGNNKNALEEAKNYSTYVINEIIKSEQNSTAQSLDEIKNNSIIIDDNNEREIANNTIPKRRMTSYEADILNKIELLDCLNKTEDITKIFDRGNFDRESKRWTSQEPEKAIYNTVGRNEQLKTNRAVSEKGLIKVLSMLTNTFKKIMKQHNDIKEIHTKLHVINENFMKNIEIVSDKFQDFETKYTTLVALNKKVAEIEERLSTKEKHFFTREKEMSKNLIEFEMQQKKFLTQQRQFYDIQKLMLEQNEKINTKQNAIAKMQGEISHRQNNFARILKKAKQVYLDSKSGAKTSVAKIMKVAKTDKLPNITISHIATTQPPVHRATNFDTAESIKINLFSIPTVSKIENQDHLLLNERDENTVDDLVYKYYFNNTFIDSLMRNFLTGFMNFGDNNDSIHSVKSKRDEVIKQTTVLLPVKNASDDDLAGKSVNRQRRWISHHSRKKGHHKHRGKTANENFDLDDEKPVKESKKATEALLDAKPAKLSPNESNNSKIGMNIHKNVAFIVMAHEFCNGIGQNSTQQILEWCMEKALRRLQNIDIKMPPPPPIPSEATTEFVEVQTRNSTLTTGTVTKEEPSTPKPTTTLLPNSEPPVTITPLAYTPISTYYTQAMQDYTLFFPDNDKLESNLKQYELTPDKEGNVYYEGSLHASEMLKGRNDDSESDFLPGVESNSRIDMIDPETFHTQAVRRALFSRMKYESMMKKLSKL